MRNVIVYHRSCPDGFGAAWYLRQAVLRQHPTGEVVLVSANWGDEPDLELMSRAEVYCVDYCYEPAGLAAIAEHADTLTVLDHHQTSLQYAIEARTLMGRQHAFFDSVYDFIAASELGGLDRVEIVIDQRYSGVGLVVEFVRRWQGWCPPQFLWNLQDRDLWRFELPDTRDVFAAVTARPYTIEAWDQLEQMAHETLIAEGKGINMYRDQLIESVAASTFKLEVVDKTMPAHQRWVPCASSPYFIGSDVAGLLAERDPGGVGAYCILHDDHVQIGLRSRGADGPDVAKMAEVFDGGGHMHASGYKLSWVDFAQWANDDCMDLFSEARAITDGLWSPLTAPGADGRHLASASPPQDVEADSS